MFGARILAGDKKAHKVREHRYADCVYRERPGLIDQEKDKAKGI
jgi:hypothetical protein